MRAAIEVAYKAQVCFLLAGSLESFDISICSCFSASFFCFCTACIGNILSLAILGVCKEHGDIAEHSPDV
jgi:hypothetical protein